MKNIAIALLLLLPSVSLADHITLLLDGKPLPVTNATITLVAGSNGELALVRINGGGVVPDPNPTPGPVNPPIGLLDTMTRATTAVADYATKDEDARAIAFNITFVSPYLKGTANASEITAVLKTMSDASMGSNADNWASWWATFDTATKNMSIEQYKNALGVATAALTANSNFASGEFMGSESFGLDLTKLMKLLEFVMKYLPMILSLFA